MSISGLNKDFYQFRKYQFIVQTVDYSSHKMVFILVYSGDLDELSTNQIFCTT